jgi:lysophospholipase L1-like esterase
MASSTLACSPLSVASEPPHAPDPVVRFVGRFDTSDPAGPRFAWSASAILTRFAAASLHVRLKDTGYDELEVVLDGAPVKVLSINPAREDYEVVSGLDGRPHELRLIKRTEARMGELQFLGFDAATPLSSPAPTSPRHIELVGDSITAGYGDEGGGISCQGDAVSFENEYLSYGAIASRSLHADHVTVAWAGRTTAEMSRLYERTLPAHADSHWEPSRWVPNVIVVNLGTNDFNRGDPGQVAFTRPYVAFLRRLRAIHPHAEILCTLGPMLTDGYPPGVHALTHARAYITAAVAEVHAAGDAKVSFLEFATQDAANGRGCDYHPSKKTHALMAEQLAATLREKLAW